MTAHQRKKLWALINDPHPGSKLAAERPGVDMIPVLENLELTPTERVTRMYQIADLLERIRKAQGVKSSADDDE